MRVGIDGRALAARRGWGGIARYTADSVAALARAYPGDEWIVFVPGREDLLVAPDWGMANLRVVRHPLPSRLVFGPAAIAGRPRLDRLLGGKIDLVWAPLPAPMAVSAGVPLVLTLHDLSWEQRPQDYSRYRRIWHRAARVSDLVRKATHLVAVSRHTAELASRRWPEITRRLTVVHSGVTRPAAPVSPETSHALQERLKISVPYFLFVGALEPRKGVDLLLQAFAGARRAGLAAELVVVGSGRLGSAVRGARVRLLTGASQAELDALYAGALALVMPSWVEGFGFPALEAACSATPALVSDLPVFAETLGPAALRVAPGDVDALRDGLLTLAADPQRRARLGEAAQAAVATLTWERCAGKLHTVLAAAGQ